MELNSLALVTISQLHPTTSASPQPEDSPAFFAHFSPSSYVLPAASYRRLSTSIGITMPADATAQQAPGAVPEPTAFFSLPRELRDMIYSHLFHAVNKSSGEIVPFRMRPSNCVSDRGEFELSDRLAILQASRRLWDESSKIFYGKHLFRFHLGCRSTNATFLTQRTVYLMQDIGISVCAGKANASLRIIQVLGASQKLRNSCSIKLRFRSSQWISDDMAYALKKLHRFNLLTIDVDESVARKWPQPNRRSGWEKHVLHHMQAILETRLGPSIILGGDVHPHLIFNPQDHIMQKAVEKANVQKGASPNIVNKSVSKDFSGKTIGVKPKELERFLRISGFNIFHLLGYYDAVWCPQQDSGL